MASVATVALLSLFASDGGADGAQPPGTPSAPASSTEPSPEPERTEEPSRFATKLTVNREGEYSFAHPPRWELVTDGSVSTVTSPNEDIVVTFGFGAPGDLGDASADLEDLIRSSYDVIDISQRGVAELAGARTVRFDGSARNIAGVIVGLDVFTIDGPGQENYAITVFSRHRVSGSSSAAIDEIISSFSFVAAG